jgi:type II secretory pathway component PulF
VRGGGATGRASIGAPERTAPWAPSADAIDLLAALLEAGLPLTDALATIEGSAVDAPTRGAARHLKDRVRSGHDLSSSLEELAAPAHVRMLVDGGERTGRLVPALRHAARLTDRLDLLRSEARRALVYPGLVLAIGLAILVVIAVAVVPPLERTFADLGGELPRATRLVLAVSGPLSSPSAWTLVVLGCASIVLGRRWSASSEWIPPWVRVRRITFSADHLPLWGSLRRDLRLTVLAHVMATLSEGGVPLDTALRHVSETIGSQRAAQVLREASSMTQRGSSPFVPEQLGRLLDAAELAMLGVGERTGLLAEQWSRIASRRDRALEERIRRTSVVIEPVLVALVGIVVGGAVVALYLPTFRVIELL